MQDFLASGHIIRKNAKEILNIISIDNELIIEACKHFLEWRLRFNKKDKEADINYAERLKHITQKLYEENKTNKLSPKFGRIYRLSSQLFWRLRCPGEPIKKLNMEEEQYHNDATECWICKKAFKEDLLKKV